MTEFKVGDRVRLIEDYGKKTKGYEGVVEKVEDIASMRMRERGILCEQMVHVNGGLAAFNVRFELAEKPWEFEVGKYYRNIKNPKHIVRVNAFTPKAVYFTVVSSPRINPGDYHLGYECVKRVWEPCGPPKVMVEKSGWIITCVGKNSDTGQLAVMSGLYQTQPEAVIATHASWKNVTYHHIEWEEEVSHAETTDDDMV